MGVPLQLSAFMKMLWIPALVALITPFSEAQILPGTIERPPILIRQGEQRMLRIPGISRYSLGGESVRTTPIPKGALGQGQDPKDFLLLKGSKPGKTDLWVWKQDGTVERRSIQVNSLDLKALNRIAPFEEALSQLQEVEVIQSGNKTLLRGEFETVTEAARIFALRDSFPDQVTLNAHPSKRLFENARESLERWLKTNESSLSGGAELQLVRQGHALKLVGFASSPSTRAWIEKETREIYPLLQLELGTLPDSSPVVHFRVYLLEIRKEHLTSLGIGWPPLQADAFQLNSWGLKNNLKLDLALQALEQDGSARLLSRPELVVRAPGEAELFAGGELPIRTNTAYASQLNWKSFGLLLKLKVTHATAEKVRLDILTEVSHLDHAIALGEVPGLQSNRMKTQVDARFGSPLLLSGLLQEGTRQKARGLPWMQKIPVLGKLFGSEDYLNEKSELVAILVPNGSPPKREVPRLRSSNAPLEEVASKAPARILARPHRESSRRKSHFQIRYPRWKAR